MTDEKKTYEVGYKKPPAATRFQPGISGNSKGRAKGSRNFGTALVKELNSLIEVTENGKRKKITKRDAIAKQVVNKAVTGDHKVVATLLNEARLHEEPTITTAPAEHFSAQEDSVVMEGIVKRLKRAESSVELPTPSEYSI